MAVTNELTSDFPKVATTAMGQALLRGGTIRTAVVWAARHPADYALLTALSHPVITGSETPSPYDYDRHATLTAITYQFPSLLVFIPGAGSGPFMQVNTAAVRTRAVDEDLAGQASARVPADDDRRWPRTRGGGD